MSARISRCLLVSLATVLLLCPSAATAQDDKGGDKKQSSLPLGRVVLFSSGVGFYEHTGEVTGDSSVELKFNVDDVNDLLKSMVLQDLGGGRISTVTYGSKDPITKTLQTFAVDLTSNPTLAGLLEQIRGEKVKLEAPTPITGTIVGVERKKVKIKEEDFEEQEFVVLLTAAGLRKVDLGSVSSIQLLDEGLNAELQKALEVLAMGHSTDKKSVKLDFLGTGKREVRVGYVQESPIWKTSYRLVLSEDDAPFLQGWAIVENTTEEDWNGVDLTLVSGRPISYVMNLYDPLYVHRPVVEPELYASLRPQTYGQSMRGLNEEFERLQQRTGLKRERGAVEKLAEEARTAGAAGRSTYADTLGAADYSLNAPMPSDAAGKAFDPTSGVSSVAQASDVGELFRYTIATPVTLPRQQSAMLPIVNESVEGEKLSIYNTGVHSKHPLNGLRLKNSTELHLMQGPVTVFDGGVYAGDARVEDLQPGTERLISYALDLDVEVAPEPTGHPEQLVSVRIVKGVVHTARKYRREHKYTIKNSGDEEKQILIEQPLEAGWNLVTPKEATEKTRDRYRFAVTATPGKAEELKIAEEQTVHQEVALTNLDDRTIVFYVNSKVVSEDVKKSLQEVLKRKAALNELVAKRQQLEQQIQIVDQEQARIRQNMERLDRNSDLYNRYVKKFGEQEDQVEELRTQIRELNEQEAKLRKSLDEYLAGLTIE